MRQYIKRDELSTGTQMAGRNYHRMHQKMNRVHHHKNSITTKTMCMIGSDDIT